LTVKSLFPFSFQNIFLAHLYDCDKKNHPFANTLKLVETCSNMLANQMMHLFILYKTKRFSSLGTHFISNRATVQSDNIDQMERDLIAQAA